MSFENTHGYCPLEAEKFTPLGDRILVQWEEKKDLLLDGKLVLPATLTRQHYTGVVLKIGNGVDLDLKKGDRVAFEQFSGFDKFFDEKLGRLALLRQSHCYAIIPKRTKVANGMIDYDYAV